MGPPSLSSITRDYRDWRRIARFLLVGLSGVLINELVLWYLVDVLHFSMVIIAVVISSEVSILSNFLLNDRWTFSDRRVRKDLQGLGQRMLHYHWTRVVGMAIGISTFFILFEILRIHYLLANLVAIGIGVMWGFSTSLHIVWRETPTARVELDETSGPPARGLPPLLPPAWRRALKVVLPSDMRLWLGVVLFIVTMSTFEIYYFWNFRIYEWDMGIWNQAFSSTLTGQNLRYNSELFLNRDGFFLATHFAPALYLFLPFYAIYPSVEALLVVHTVLVALGAAPTYRIAEHLTGDRNMGLFFGSLYLILPSTWGITISGLHLEDIFLVSTLCSLAGLVQNRPLYFAGFGVLSSLSIEWASVPVVLLGVYGLLVHMRGERRMRQASIFLILFGIPWLYFAMQMRYVLGLLVHASLWHEWEILGASSITDIPLRLLHSPGSVLPALAFQGGVKVNYIIFLFLPLGFLPLVRPFPLLPATPWFVMALLSNYGAYYSVWDQYPAFVLPFLMLSAAMAMLDPRVHRFTDRLIHVTRRIFQRCKEALSMRSAGMRAPPPGAAPPSRLRRVAAEVPATLPLLGVLAAVTLIFSFGSASSLLGPPIDPGHSSELHDIIRRIPSNASILTQNNIFPHVSSRSNAYTIPSPMWGVSLAEAARTMLDNFECSDFEWVLIDYNTNVFAVAGGDLINQSFVQRCNTGRIIFLIEDAVDGIVLFHNSLYSVRQEAP